MTRSIRVLTKKESVSNDKKIGADHLMILRNLSPDFDEWPKRWMGLKEDLEYGKKLLPYMEEFLDDLIKRDVSLKTLKNHIDNTWLLGGSIIKHVSMYEDYKTAPLKKLVESVKAGGMLPDGYDQMTERDLRAFERTCELFEEFLKKTATKEKIHAG